MIRSAHGTVHIDRPILTQAGTDAVADRAYKVTWYWFYGSLISAVFVYGYAYILSFHRWLICAVFHMIDYAIAICVGTAVFVACTSFFASTYSQLAFVLMFAWRSV